MPGYAPYEVTIKRHHPSRDDLEPIPGSPWLAKKAPKAAWVPLVAAFWVVAVLASLPVPGVTVLLLLVPLVIAIGYKSEDAGRQTSQYCPCCLTEMGRGATKCRGCRSTEASLCAK